MNKKNVPTIITAIIVLVIVSLFVTKPDDESLRRESASYAKTEIEKDMPGNDFNAALVERIAEKSIDNSITFEDKFLWKEVIYSFNGKSKTLGYGYFNGFHPTN